MSEFLAEASVLIQANTVAFKRELEAALATVPKGIEIPVIAVARTGTVAGAVATMERSTQSAAVASEELAAASAGVSANLEKETAAATTAAVSLQALEGRTLSIGLANRSLAAASEQFAAAQATVAGSSLRVEAAQSAVAAAEQAVASAAASGTKAQKTLAASALEAAVAFEKQAISAAKSASVTSAAASRDIAKANLAAAAASEKLAVAQGPVAGSFSAAAEAQLVYNRAVVATAAASEALDVALRHGSTAQITIARNALQAAAAFEKEALAANELAAANERAATSAGHQAVAQRNVARGAATSALAAIGLRGATLTANAGFIAGAAGAIAFGKSLQSFAGFETSLNTLQAVSGATADQMAAISEQARQLGSDITLPSVGAQDAAEAMLELSKAGLSVEDSMAGARGVLQLATAAQIDNAEATQITASALNAFGLAGDQAVHVADVLANAANLSQGSIEDVGISLQQVSAVSRQVGISFEDTAALLTLLARNGIQGSDAGTSLRVAFTRLINPTEKARKILEGLNLQLRDQQGNLRPEVFAEFANAQSGLSRSQQDANAGIVFGTDALRAYSIAAREGLQGIQNVRAELDKQGTAAELAGARTKGSAGSFENLKNQASRLGIAIGENLAPATSDFIDILAGGIQNLATAEEQLNNLQGSADETGRSFAELAQEAGKVNFAVAVRGSEAGQGLLDEQTKLNKALEESLGPGIAATNMIEGYRDALHSAALQAEGLRNRVDESADRFTKQPVPATPQPVRPTPIGPTAKLDRRAALAAATGNLDALQEVQQETLAKARQALVNSHGNVKQREALFEKVTQAEAALASTQKQISEKVASDQQQKAQDAKAALQRAADARQKADQAVLDSFAGKQNRIDLAEVDANSTERLSDDIAVQRLIARTASREIAIIDKTVRDAKTRNAAIAERVQALKEAAAELDRLRKEQATAQAEKAQQARDLVTTNLEKKLQLAQIVGKKDPILAAFDALIANERKNLAAAKKADKLDALIALRQTIKDRNDFLESLKKDAEDANKNATTAFDLLTQFSQVFNQNAGNLIGGNQPFAGPTGFTADIAQFLIRRQPPPGTAPQFPGKAADNTLVQANTRLTDAIIDLTEEIRTGGKGNGSTATKVQSVRASRQWHSENMLARQFQEG